MIINDLRAGFYDLLQKQKVLILTTNDVDSLATVKILLQLFRVDSVYTVVVPVEDYTKLRDAYVPYADNIKHVILINCGATIGILNLFRYVPHDAIFYILDHQRPLSVFNIYDESNRVRIVAFTEDETIPRTEDVFAEMSEDEGLESDDDDELSLDEHIRFLQVQHRRKKRQAAVERRRKRMAEKAQYLFDYTQYYYCSKPSAYIALNLAMQLGQATPEIIWWGAIGITHCFHLRRIDRVDYIKLVSFVEGEVSRVANKNYKTRFDFKISHVNELDLLLYKQWSVWDSCTTTPSWILTFMQWTDTGYRRLKLFFAESGLAHARLKQSYPYMPKPVKEKLEPSIKKYEKKYNFKDWFLGTFTASYGCTYLFTAIDIQLAAMGVLDGGSPSTRVEEKFQDGLECLGKEGLQVIKHGIDLSKKMLAAVYKQMRLALMMELIIAYASVLVGKFVEREFNFKYNTSTSYMKMFAKFTQEAFVMEHKVRKYKYMPFVFLVPIDHEYVMAIGESPLIFDSPRTQFKRVFEQTAKRMNDPDQVVLDHFDPAMCKVKAEYRDEFIEKLIAVLTP